LEKQAKKFEEINNTSEGNVTPNCHPELVEGTQEEKSCEKKEEMFSTFADSAENQTEKNRQKEMQPLDFVIPSCHPELVEGAVEVTPLKKATPTIEIVKTYFQENNFPELEAQKFFNYFSSIGWLVGGKTPMTNWQAAAQNWMINAPKFISNPEQPNRAKNLNTTTEKNYAEPL
jgi:hypothetical protein